MCDTVRCRYDVDVHLNVAVDVHVDLDIEIDMHVLIKRGVDPLRVPDRRRAAGSCPVSDLWSSATLQEAMSPSTSLREQLESSHKVGWELP